MNINLIKHVQNLKKALSDSQLTPEQTSAIVEVAIAESICGNVPIAPQSELPYRIWYDSKGKGSVMHMVDELVEEVVFNAASVIELVYCLSKVRYELHYSFIPVTKILAGDPNAENAIVPNNVTTAVRACMAAGKGEDYYTCIKEITANIRRRSYNSISALPEQE